MPVKRLSQSMIALLVGSVLALASLPCIAADTNFTKGTNQMAGGNGLFGQVYTLVSSDGFGPINFEILSAGYSVERVNMETSNSCSPKVGEKLLIIHYRIKNPNTADLYYSGRNLFQAVDADNNLIQDSGNSRRATATQRVSDTIKPGPCYRR